MTFLLCWFLVSVLFLSVAGSARRPALPAGAFELPAPPDEFVFPADSLPLAAGSACSALLAALPSPVFLSRSGRRLAGAALASRLRRFGVVV